MAPVARAEPCVAITISKSIQIARSVELSIAPPRTVPLPARLFNAVDKYDWTVWLYALSDVVAMIHFLYDRSIVRCWANNQPMDSHGLGGGEPPVKGGGDVPMWHGHNCPLEQHQTGAK